MTMTTAPNPLDAAMPLEVLDDLAHARYALLRLVPELHSALVDAEAALDRFDREGHGLTDDQFTASFAGSEAGQLRQLCADIATAASPDADDECGVDELMARHMTADTMQHSEDDVEVRGAAVVDEVRCRRLVIVDDQGVERIVGGVGSDGPSLVVRPGSGAGSPSPSTGRSHYRPR